MERAQDRNAESQPIWESGQHVASTSVSEPTYEGPLEADTVIVGAGISGLSIAYEVLGRGRSAIVLDKAAEVGGGETGRSTAHLADALDDRYYLLERLHGRDGARLAAESHRAGIESIARIVASEHISCAFERLDGYLFESGEQPTVLQKELEAAARAGVRVELVGELSALGHSSALKFANQAQMDPLAYVRGLAEAVRRRGGQLALRSHVRDIRRHKSRTTITLADGRCLEARDVVVATNSPIHDLMAMHTKQAAYRSYVLGFEAAGSSLPRALFWDTGDPYHYVRYAGETLLVGGADHRVGEPVEAEQPWRELEQWARARLPGLGEINSRWSGQVMEPMDGLGFIGRNPGDSTYIVTGDSGNGMTHGALAGLLIADLITGVPNAWAELYAPARRATSLPSLKEYVRDNAKVALAYTDWLRPSPGTEQSLQPGQGAVMQAGLTKLAVYVDDAGERHECLAVCPHLGGVVRWNAAERSWDCPCHGSRFDPLGNVLAGPANRGLAPAHRTR